MTWGDRRSAAGIPRRSRVQPVGDHVPHVPGEVEGLLRLMRHDSIATTAGYVFLDERDLGARLERVAL